MAQANLGSKQGLTGIPSLLLSTLGTIKDKDTQRALYQIQNWANSLGLVNGETGGGSAALGANFPGANASAPTLWTTVTVNGVLGYIPVWT